MSIKKVFTILFLCGGMMIAGCTVKKSSTKTKLSYTVSWVVEGKTVETDKGVKKGEMPHYDGATPEKESTAQYSYTFKGWTPEITAVTQDVTYTAEFDSSVRSYTITFKNGDQVMQSSKVAYGAMPNYTGQTPTKAATAQYSYTFKGWSPALKAVTGDATYTAEFNSTVNSYTIEFKNGDEVLQSSKVAYGSTPVYSGATPTKAETADCTYTFKGWSPAVVAVTGNATYSATFNEVKKFTDNNLGYFVGEFYGTEGVLNISKDGATITKGGNVTTLTNKAIEGDGFETEVSYMSGQVAYTVSWAEGDKKFVEVSANGEVAEFMPSIASIQGWYTGYGDVYDDNIIYIVSNDFNEELGFFNVAMASKNYGVYSVANYAKSYFAQVGEEVKLGWDFYYSDDLTEPSAELYAEKRESGKIDLMWYDYEDFLFESSASVFSFTFFNPEELSSGLWAYGLFFSDLDEESKTVCVGWDDEPITYVEGYDENGSFVAVGDMKIYGSRYGAFVETSEGVVEMPFFMSSDFYRIYDVEFSDAGATICFTMDGDTYEDVVMIDGVASDTFELDIYNRELVIKATKGEDVYYLKPSGDDETLKVVKNGVSIVYINESKFKDLFVKDYFMTNGLVFSVDSSLVIHVSAYEINASLKYTEDYGVVLVFDGTLFGVSGNMYMKNAGEDYGLYVFFNPANTQQGSYLVEKAYVEGYYGEWTCGSFDITISSTGVVSEDITLISGLKFVTLQTQLGEFIPTLYAGGDFALALFGDQGTTLYQVGTSGLAYVGSFIPKDMFEAAVGEYCLNGQFGVETVKLTADGKLIVDTTNSSGTGVEPVEYEYSLMMYEGKVVAQFSYNDYPVSVTFDGNNHCSILIFTYLQKIYFDNQGAFTDGTNIISIVDNVVKYNGSVVSVSSTTENSIVGTVGGKDIEITFDGTGASVAIEESTVTLAKSPLSLSSFICKRENVSGLGYDVEVKADGIYWGMTGKTLYKMSSYEYALDEGEVVIKFSYAGIDYTIKLVEGEVVITGKSNIPVHSPLSIC